MRLGAVVSALVVLGLLQAAVSATAVVVALAAVFGGIHAGAIGPDDETSSGSDGPERRPDVRPSPGRDADGGDDVWRLDGFADFSDVRMTVTGAPGAGWTESRLSGRTVWVDDRCRVSAEVVDVGADVAGLTDAAASEDLARSIGAAAFGGAATLSDPDPATIRLPRARAGGAVELASVALVPAQPRPDGASFVVVSVRASVEHRRAVVFALACVGVPASRADLLAHDLSGRFRLETRSEP